MIRTRVSSPQLSISRESLRLFSLDLREALPEIKPRIKVDVAFHERPITLDAVPLATIQQRIIQGDKIFAAYHQSKPVAYLFTTTKSCWVSEVQNLFCTAEDEVYLYDAFTSAEYRRYRIYTFLINTTVRFFKKQAFSYALIFSSASNIHSLKAIKLAGFKDYETVHFYNFLGIKMWNFIPRSNDVQSRFTNEI